MNTLTQNIKDRALHKLKAQYEHIVALMNIYKQYTNQDQKDATIRSIGTIIFDIHHTVLNTNLWSDRLINDVNAKLIDGIRFSKIIKTPEHFIGRNKAAHTLCTMFDTITFDEFCKFVLDYCSYHRVTSEENSKLVKILKESKHWIEAYEKATIELYEINIIRDGNRITRVQKVRRVESDELKQRFKY